MSKMNPRQSRPSATSTPENSPAPSEQPQSRTSELPEPPESQPLSTEASAELEALESVRLSDLETAGNGAEDPAELQPFEQPSANSAGILTKEQFFTGVFRPVHDLPGQVMKLQSLPIKENELEAARGASDAVYDTALEVPWLRFLVEPSNIYVQRAIVIAAYAIPKAIAVRAEVMAMKSASGTPMGEVH